MTGGNAPAASAGACDPDSRGARDSRPRLLVVGHLTEDVTPDGPRLGGAAAFAGLLARGFGVPTAILTAADAAFPYLDSFTTVAAVVTTYMVAKKVLENWIYWFVIDSVSVYLYAARELPLYAALFVFYLVLIVIGFRQWLADWREGRPVPAETRDA